MRTRCEGSGNPSSLSPRASESPALSTMLQPQARRAALAGLREARSLGLEAAQEAPRAPRRDSRGERSPWLPLETRPDSPGEPGGNETSFLFAACEGGHTDSFYPKDASTHGERGDQANKRRQITEFCLSWALLCNSCFSSETFLYLFIL